MSKEPKIIIAYKGFDENWQCRGFQYEIGKSYEHEGEVGACHSGFHACEHPLDVLKYYHPNTSKFALVELSGKTASEENGDTKIAAANIHIKAEIELGDLAQKAVDYVFKKAKWLKSKTTNKDNGGVTASGRYGAATASGEYGAATASGRYGAATASGWYGAATASGRYGAATASGRYGAATASGRYGAATASGHKGKARGVDGNALFLCDRNDDYEIIAVWAGIVGKDGIKPDTFYVLQDGEPVECD